MKFEVLLDEAMRLPPEQRGTLAHRLLDSLKPEGAELDAAAWEQTWTEELRQRLANDDGQRFDLGQTLTDLRAHVDAGCRY